VPSRSESLYLTILRNLVAQNDIVDIMPLIKKAALPDGRDSIEKMVLDLELEDFQMLLVLIKDMSAEKHQILIAAAHIAYEKLLAGMTPEHLNELLRDEAQPMINNLRNALEKALSLGVNESAVSVWVFDTIADGLATTGYPKEIINGGITWICSQVLSNPPSFTGEEIKANIEKRISDAATAMESEEEYRTIQAMCKTAAATGLSLESFWEQSSPDAARERNLLLEYIARATRREVTVQEYVEFQKSTMIQSACLYNAIKRWWPEQQ